MVGHPQMRAVVVLTHAAIAAGWGSTAPTMVPTPAPDPTVDLWSWWTNSGSVVLLADSRSVSWWRRRSAVSEGYTTESWWDYFGSTYDSCWGYTAWAMSRLNPYRFVNDAKTEIMRGIAYYIDYLLEFYACSCTYYINLSQKPKDGEDESNRGVVVRGDLSDSYLPTFEGFEDWDEREPDKRKCRRELSSWLSQNWDGIFNAIWLIPFMFILLRYGSDSRAAFFYLALSISAAYFGGWRTFIFVRNVLLWYYNWLSTSPKRNACLTLAIGPVLIFACKKACAWVLARWGPEQPADANEEVPAVAVAVQGDIQADIEPLAQAMQAYRKENRDAVDDIQNGIEHLEETMQGNQEDNQNLLQQIRRLLLEARGRGGGESDPGDGGGGGGGDDDNPPGDGPGRGDDDDDDDNDDGGGGGGSKNSKRKSRNRAESKARKMKKGIEKTDKKIKKSLGRLFKSRY